MKTATQTPATDNQLVKFFQNGDNNALEVLVNRHKDKIFTSISILVKDKYLAEDLFQRVFIRIIDILRSDRYNEEGKFFPWALRIAHSICMDHFRKVKRTPPVTTSDNRNIFEEISASGESVNTSTMEGESCDDVSQIIEMLPDEQREVIILRHYADLSFKEIAQITGCSINTALGYMRQGLLNMRQAIGEKQIAL